LANAARQKGLDMLDKNYWAHVSPDGTEPWDFFLREGYVYKYAGENLARDFTNPESAVAAWMASPSHRDNLLSSKYEEIGIAVVEGDLSGQDTTLIVQLFGTKSGDRLPVVPVASIETQTEEPEIVRTASAEEPEEVPETSVTKKDTVEIVSAESEIITSGNLSSFAATRALSIMLITVMLVTVFVDMVIVSRKRIKRIGGRPFAHLSFFIIVLAILLIIEAGEIL